MPRTDIETEPGALRWKTIVYPSGLWKGSVSHVLAAKFTTAIVGEFRHRIAFKEKEDLRFYCVNYSYVHSLILYMFSFAKHSK
jgi:hypothetical protein